MCCSTRDIPLISEFQKQHLGCGEKFNRHSRQLLTRVILSVVPRISDRDVIQSTGSRNVLLESCYCRCLIFMYFKVQVDRTGPPCREWRFRKRREKWLVKFLQYFPCTLIARNGWIIWDNRHKCRELPGTLLVGFIGKGRGICPALLV